MPTNPRGLFLPELVDRKVRPWTKHHVEIRDAAVNLRDAEAWVPEAWTIAQRLARLHELAHVYWTPHSYTKHIARIMTAVGKGADYTACLKLTKMLEENRIDWLLWDRRGIDLRPAREALDWALMPDPANLLHATCIVLQLAWTVWASRGLGKGIPNEPPRRVPDPDVGEYFDKAWKMVADENFELARAIIRGCLKMYANPSNTTRNAVVAELATFFLVEEEDEPEQPPEKPEEKEAQKEAKEKHEQHEKEKEAEETGIGAEKALVGQVEYHDHTTSIRRQNVRIVRRMVPVTQGIHLRYTPRLLIDKAIFGQRMLTEGGIMIDGSSSMRWTDDDMKLLVERLPAVTVGLYSGHDQPGLGQEVIGRICTLAKNGKFSKFTGIDPGSSGGNAVDLEALRLLAKWPAPRLWLSDGQVCGGLHQGPCDHHSHVSFPMMQYYGNLIHECDRVMKQYGILRVPNRDVMAKLLKREPVILYRNCQISPGEPHYDPKLYPPDMRSEPARFQL